MILISDTSILTQDKDRRLIKDGAVLIKGAKIAAVGKAEDMKRKYGRQAKKIIKAKNKIVIPGLINTHTHLAMARLRGYADDLPLEKWWFEKIYPAESKFTKKDVYSGSLLGALEMIKSGTTCFSDFYYFPDEVIRAVKIVGIRANVGIAILDTKTFAYSNRDEIIQTAEKTAKKYRDDETVRISVAPHMLQTASLETYKISKKLADHYGLILQTHLAETKNEVDFCREKYGLRPAELLIKNKILDENSLTAHCCWLTDKEIKLMAGKNVKISHCPVSNMKLAAGIMPLDRILKRGITVSLGTDGACSNNSLDLFGEMKSAALLAKIASKNPASAPAQTILDMATINGARALNWEKEIGSIEVGKCADLIIVDFNKPHLVPVYDIVSHLVYAAKGSDVETVIINGKIIMENNVMKTVNEKNFYDQFQNS